LVHFYLIIFGLRVEAQYKLNFTYSVLQVQITNLSEASLSLNLLILFKVIITMYKTNIKDILAYAL